APPSETCTRLRETTFHLRAFVRHIESTAPVAEIRGLRSMIETNDTNKYIRGDAVAAREGDFTTSQLRNLRTDGKLRGAGAKLGHRTTLYHRDRLKRCIAAVFEA